jgi:hypothetical protein
MHDRWLGYPDFNDRLGQAFFPKEDEDEGDPGCNSNLVSWCMDYRLQSENQCAQPDP